MPKKKTKKNDTPDAAQTAENLTLEELASRYLASLDRSGAGLGTIQSYGMELNLALRELGKDTLAAALTSEQVASYFASDAVTRTRSGVLKAKPTVDKSRRVLRQALVFGEKAGLIAKAPLPEAPAKV